MDIVDRDCRSVGAQGGDGDVAQPDGFFDQRAGAVVLAQEVAGFVISVENCTTGAAADPDPLAEGVVEGGLGRGGVGGSRDQDLFILRPCWDIRILPPDLSPRGKSKRHESLVSGLAQFLSFPRIARRKLARMLHPLPGGLHRLR